MRGSGKFPRFALSLAILLPLLLIYDLLFVHFIGTRVLLSNILTFALLALAALCCARAALRDSGYARQVWMLLAIAIAIEALGQAASSYYQTFVPGSLFIPEPSDVLFFVWAAPVFMILLPRSDSESLTLDSIRLLDFLQVSIVVLTVYVYFFYTPSRWQNNSSHLILGLLALYIFRDLILAAGFFLRSRASRLPWFRSFSRVLAVAFFVAALSDVIYLMTIRTSLNDATWADIFWFIPYLLLIAFSLRWQPVGSTSVSLPSTRFGSLFTSQFLPMGLPLLVILMARVISREQFFVGWLTVIASVLCSSARLVLANRKQRRIADDLLSAETALRRSEQMLSTAFRSSPDAFSINVFPNGPYLEINEGYTRLTGYTREDTIGKTPGQMNLWTDPAERAQVLSQITQTGDIRDYEFHFRNKSGNTRVGLMSASIVELDSRPCALVVVRDITARKDAENILRTSEERFRSLVQNLHVGIITYDPHGRILFANQAVVDLVGMPLDQVMGKTTIELGIVCISEDGTVVPPELRPIASVAASRKPVRSLFLGWLVPNRPDPIWTLLDLVPEFSSTGELLRIVVSITDLTEQRRAAAALRESEERFRTLVHDIHVGVVLHQSDGAVEYANPAAYRIFRAPSGSAIGKTPEDFRVSFVAEDGRTLSAEDHPVRVVLRTRTPVENYMLGVLDPRFPGVTRWLFGNAVPQFDAHGNVLRVISLFSEVTEMKNAERAIHQLSTQLLRLQDEERRRLGRELHDGLAQTVLAINLSLAQVRQSLQHAEQPAIRALEKARSLTQQMSREIRTLSYLLHPPLLDDLGLVSALREYAQGFSERSGIDTHVYVLSSFSRLTQPLELALFRIVQESLANIQRHSGSATAKIRVHQQGTLVTLEIVDSGRGMTRSPNGSSPSGEPRLGVGIPGMRERMAQLGGHLDILSSATGTTVRATISVSDAPVLDDFSNADSESLTRPS